jgi:hypothetical protein
MVFGGVKASRIPILNSSVCGNIFDFRGGSKIPEFGILCRCQVSLFRRSGCMNLSGHAISQASLSKSLDLGVGDLARKPQAESTMMDLEGCDMHVVKTLRIVFAQVVQFPPNSARACLTWRGLGSRLGEDLGLAVAVFLFESACLMYRSMCGDPQSCACSDIEAPRLARSSIEHCFF